MPDLPNEPSVIETSPGVVYPVEALKSIAAGSKLRAAIDVKSLAAKLQESIEGEVRFDAGSRALYATDGSNYRQVPIGVVVPKTKEDVIRTVAICRSFHAPILSRGGGTSLAGQCCNVAVVMDFSKYLHHVLRIDAEAQVGVVEPGCVLDRLREEANRHGLTFGPDPATHTHCTLGGMSGNNSCGIHSQMSGRTSDNIHALEIVTYDGCRMRVGKTSDEELEQIIAEGGRRGEIYGKLKKLRDTYEEEIRKGYPKIPRRISGYNLDELLPENGFNVARALIGSEGTLVTILEIETDLVPNPKARSLVVLGYPDIATAGDHVTEIAAHHPIGLEGIDNELIEYYRIKGKNLRDLALLPEGNSFLTVEFGGDSKEESDQKARALMDALKSKPDAPSMKLYDKPKEEREIWKVRESALGATAFIPGKPDNWPGWEDSAVPPERVGPYLRELRKLFERFGYDASVYGHLGQGCIHCRIPFELTTAEGIENYRHFMDEATDLVLRFGGSLSGEHGDGQSRAEFLPKMFGPVLMQAMREFKEIWDPEWMMNPGKVMEPYKVTENLRLGTSYNPRRTKTHFHFAEDEHDFSRAALRCVGVGNCRREKGEGVMCPSYMVTREEKDSTRGRARMLFEMLNGSELEGGWKNEAVKDALDLCLSCKGCKQDCPVNVDMATYKAEFLSHYYKGRVRPMSAYAFGFIDRWSRLAARAPLLVNLVNGAPGLSALTKRLIGIAPERSLPPFASETFRAWFKRRRPRNLTGSKVVLWADTFNNHFHPSTAKAALEVLERAGFRVVVPQNERLCCGRPLYDYGLLDEARGYLLRVLDGLRAEIRAGTPVVVLEPSCWSVFADEMLNLLPNDEDAKRLRGQVFQLGEFLNRHAPGYAPPRLKRKAIVHIHCHHHAVGDAQSDMEILAKMGLEVEPSEAGCCGMAGGFGFEAGEHFRVSQECGRRKLLPTVCDAPESTLVVADGFSCREQVRQNTSRTPLHLAQVLQMALREGESGPPHDPPERKYVRQEVSTKEVLKTAAILGGILAVGFLLVARRARGDEPQG